MKDAIFSIFKEFWTKKFRLFCIKSEFFNKKVILECKTNEIFTEVLLEATCDRPGSYSHDRVKRCQCKPGYVRHNHVCVRLEKCPGANKNRTGRYKLFIAFIGFCWIQKGVQGSLEISSNLIKFLKIRWNFWDPKNDGALKNHLRSLKNLGVP